MRADLHPRQIRHCATARTTRFVMSDEISYVQQHRSFKVVPRATFFGLFDTESIRKILNASRL